MYGEEGSHFMLVCICLFCSLFPQLPSHVITTRVNSVMMRTARLRELSSSLAIHLPTIPMPLIHMITEFWYTPPVYVLTSSHLLPPPLSNVSSSWDPDSRPPPLPKATTTLWSLDQSNILNPGWQRCISWQGQRKYAAMEVSPDDGTIYIIGMNHLPLCYILFILPTSNNRWTH
jgi:cytochrome c biogenesis factor